MSNQAADKRNGSKNGNGRSGNAESPEDRAARIARKQQHKEINLFEINHYGGRSFVAKSDFGRSMFELLKQHDYLYARMMGKAGSSNVISFDVATKHINKSMVLACQLNQVNKAMSRLLGGAPYKEPSFISEYKQMLRERGVRWDVNPDAQSGEPTKSNGRDRGGKQPDPSSVELAPVFDPMGNGEAGATATAGTTLSPDIPAGERHVQPETGEHASVATVIA